MAHFLTTKRARRSAELMATDRARERDIAAHPANPSGGPFVLRGAAPGTCGEPGPHGNVRCNRPLGHPATMHEYREGGVVRNSWPHKDAPPIYQRQK